MSGIACVTSGLISFSIKVDGSSIPDELQVYSIELESAVSCIPTARITLLDGDPSKQTFAASSTNTFLPGKKLSVEAGYDNTNKEIFEGMITRQSIEVNRNGGSSLTVECRDPAVKMIVGRQSQTFFKKKDSDVISSIIKNHSGLSADVTSTAYEWPELVQNYATDWDFILSRAEANGLIVTVANGKISVTKPDADTSSVLTVTYGDNLYEIQADLDAISQLKSVQSEAWDIKSQKLVTGKASNTRPGPGNIPSRKLSEVVKLKDFQLKSAGLLERDTLNQWAQAQMIKSEYAKIQGTVRIQGNNLVVPGKYITLEGLGDRFNGDHLISSVTHNISAGNWMTRVGFGLSPLWFTEEPDVMAPSAAGLLPGVRGLTTGVVKKIDEDPGNQYRIKVAIPLFGDEQGFWARMGTFYATGGAGAFFLPEIDDEVIIGFLNEDPRFPIILGSLYSNSKHKPFKGLDPEAKNPLKAIVSKSGIQVEFDDDQKVLTLITPSKNEVRLSDKDKQILIKDQNNNMVIMASSGITMESPKDITIKSNSKVNIQGKLGVNIEASTGDVGIKGMNLKQEAQMQYSAKGSVKAEVQGGVNLTLKAAMVMIN